MPLTTYIRATALDATQPPIDRAEVVDLMERLRKSVSPVVDIRV